MPSIVQPKRRDRRQRVRPGRRSVMDRTRLRARTPGRRKPTVNATHAPQQTIDDPDVDAIERLVARFDPTVFDVGRRRARIRIEAGTTRDVVIENGTALLTSRRGSADAVLTADAATWGQIA